MTRSSIFTRRFWQNTTRKRKGAASGIARPVVNFIVRAVDDVLKSEFGLADGLADTSKITVDWDSGQTHKGKAVIEKKEIHRVQIPIRRREPARFWLSPSHPR